MTGPDLHGRRAVVVNWRDPWHHLAGGSERYAWELAQALLEAGATVEFWTARDEGQSARETRDGIDVRRRGGKYGFYLGVWVRLLAARLRRRHLDVVADMDCGIPSFTPLLLRPDSAVVLVVHHVHQAQFRGAMPRPISDLGRFLEKRVMPAVYRDLPTLAVSDSTVSSMRTQLGWRGPVRVVHNGVDPVRQGGGVADTESPERVVVLGRLVPHKRVDLVVRAFANILTRRPGMTLDVVGTGPEVGAIVAVIDELDLRDSVRLHGFVSEAAKSVVLDAARVHVVASDAEGWGQVVLEAAAHGVPTVARDVAGLRDSVRPGVTGWLLAEHWGREPERLVQGLAAGLEGALDQLSDPHARSLMADGCMRWAAGFGWDRMHAEVLEVVAEALEEKPRRA